MIRDIKENDIKDILDIYNYYILNTTISFEEEAHTLESFTERVNNIKAKYPYIVYEENNKILGYAYLNYFSTRTAYRITADLSIYINNDYQNNGIGTKLYYEIEKKAKAMGIKKIISVITNENINSLKFHESIGFKYICEIKNCAIKFNKNLGIYYMEKEI